MNKADNLFDQDSCLNRAKSDEPIFIIRAKDVCGAMAVRQWAQMSEGRHEKSKIESALKLADEMDAWRKKNIPQCVEEKA